MKDVIQKIKPHFRPLKKKAKKLKPYLRPLYKSNVKAPVAQTVDSVNLTSIFMLALIDSFKGAAQAIFLPVALGTNAIQSVFKIHFARKQRAAYKRGLVAESELKDKSFADAAFGIVTTLAIAAAIICTLIGTSATANIAPYILVPTLSLRATYELLHAGYHWYKYAKSKTQEPTKTDYYLQTAIMHTVCFITNALSAAGFGLVLLGHKSSFSGLGIAAGVIGAAYAGFVGYQAYKQEKSKIAVPTFAPASESEMIADSAQLTLELTNNALLRSQINNQTALAASDNNAPNNKAFANSQLITSEELTNNARLHAQLKTTTNVKAAKSKVSDQLITAEELTNNARLRLHAQSANQPQVKIPDNSKGRKKQTNYEFITSEELTNNARLHSQLQTSANPKATKTQASNEFVTSEELTNNARLHSQLDSANANSAPADAIPDEITMKAYKKKLKSLITDLVKNNQQTIERSVDSESINALKP